MIEIKPEYFPNLPHRAAISNTPIASYVALSQMRRAIHQHKNSLNQHSFEEGYTRYLYPEAYLEQQIVDDFDNLFHNQLTFSGRQVRLKSRFIDLLAENKTTTFIIELKIDQLVPNDVYQLHEYMQIYSDLHSPLSKELKGILICPEIYTGGIILKHYPNIFVLLFSTYNNKLILE